MKTWMAPLLTSLLGLWACDANMRDALPSIEGASHMSLRCVQEGPEGELIGLPLEGCGCTRLGPDEEPIKMGRVECSCTQIVLEGGLERLQKHSHIEVDPSSCAPVLNADGCQVDWRCEPVRGADGDWVGAAPPPKNVSTQPGAAGCPPVPAAPSVQACVPAGGGQVRAYVAAAQTGRISVLDLTRGDSDDKGEEPKRVLDMDRTIPGMSTLFVDDVITAVESDAQGRFFFTVNSSSGSLSIFFDETRGLRPALTVELGVGPLMDAVVWPPIDRIDPAPVTGRFAFVSAPFSREVLQLDLDALLRGEAVVLASFSPEGADGEPAVPGKLSVSPDGRTLIVGHALEGRLSLFELEDQSARTVTLGRADRCDDGYLVRLYPEGEDGTCADGIDNDGDGLIDLDDPDCQGEAPSEALDPLCPKISQCADGVDNDGDGLIDLDDPDCDPAQAPCADAEDPELCLARWMDWEGPLPACADGIDNDGDGLIDRFDPGCSDEADDDEADGASQQEVASCALDPSLPGCERPTCADGIDNDGDGLIDLDDPDCAAVCGKQAPCAASEGLGLPVAFEDNGLCHNGVDDDGDGLIDAEDPGCNDYNAAQRYAFERRPRCADGVDNDGDGLIDYPDDPDCYAASDDVEAPKAVSMGPTALLSAVVPLSSGARRLLYVIDPNGQLQWLDLEATDPRPVRIQIDGQANAMALRQYADRASLLVTTAQMALRPVEITGPIFAQTTDGLPVFARLASAQQQAPEVVQFYTLYEGGAVEVAPVDAGAQLTVLRAGPPFVELDADSPRVFERLETPVAVRDANGARNQGRQDYLVVVDRQMLEVRNQVANAGLTAFERSSRVVDTPRFYIDDFQTPQDPIRHPVLCRMTDGAPAVDDGPGFDACRAAGMDDQGAVESAASARSRAPERIENFEGVVVVEGDPEKMTNDHFALSYEGVLPNTESRTGLFAGAQGAQSWTLVDYEADFCRRGVEVGDTLILKQARAVSAQLEQSPECQALGPSLSQDRSRERDPARYEVLEVYPYKLVLGLHQREELCIDDPVTGQRRCQLPRSDRSGAPTLAKAAPVPSYACTARLLSYELRAGADQWLLVGDRSGYRHPWVRSGGQCLRDERLVAQGRVSRVAHGAVLENEWLRLKVGSSAAARGIRAGALPHMIDARFEFDLTVGVRRNAFTGAVASPGAMRWLPNDDRLFVIDVAEETVNEFSGFDPYESSLYLERVIR